MQYIKPIVDRLAACEHWGYHATGPVAAEPAALACLALSIHGQHQAANRVARWLADIQQADGSIGVTANQSEPNWPTSLALLAWTVLDAENPHGHSRFFREPIQQAVRWSLLAHGKSAPRQPHIGHDTTIVGWSWAEGTHSWLEPTCLFVLALQAAGQANHPRVREGLRLIADRLLPDGGGNYGNTIVLGQPLLPHIHPTGLAMMALAGVAKHAATQLGTTPDARVGKSLDYLTNALEEGNRSPRSVPTNSLCYGLMGLTAHRRRPAEADAWLQAASSRVVQQRPGAHKLALLALAAIDTWPWLPLPTTRPTAQLPVGVLANQ